VDGAIGCIGPLDTRQGFCATHKNSLDRVRASAYIAGRVAVQQKAATVDGSGTGAVTIGSDEA